MTSLLAEAERLEASAAETRVAYFTQRMERLGVRRGGILDVGCGNGYAVSAWRARGFDAIGVDRSFYRMGRWAAREDDRPPLVVADATALPFADATFGAVVSSGMIEHVGVSEISAPYRVVALEGQGEARGEAVREMSRVSSRSGAVFVDCPNGAFPIDFWHGDRLGAVRIHRVPDVLLPTYRELAAWALAAGRDAGLEPLHGRLAFRQIRSRWWGRLLAPAAATWVRVLDALVTAGLESAPARLYPYLVVVLRSVRSA